MAVTRFEWHTINSLKPRTMYLHQMECRIDLAQIRRDISAYYNGHPPPEHVVIVGIDIVNEYKERRIDGRRPSSTKSS